MVTIRSVLTIPIVFGLVVVLPQTVGGTEQGAAAPSVAVMTGLGEPDKTEHVSDAEELRKVLEALDYTLETVQKSNKAPQLFVARLPDGLSRLASVKTKEHVFMRVLLPLVLQANDEVRQQRKRLLALKEKQEKSGSLPSDDQVWLDGLAKSYSVDDGDLTELSLRVDTIPVALAMAQGIDESAWGASRLAREGNGLFGEHAPPGHKKNLEAQKARVKVAAFPSLLDGARAYMNNLNIALAYREFRRMRAKARAAGEVPKGHDLAEGLRDYSTRRGAYVKELRDLMRWHSLSAFEEVALDADGQLIFVLPAS